LRHEHAAIDLKANGLSQLNPVVIAVGAIAINRLAAGIGDIGSSGQGHQGGNERKSFHSSLIA